MSKKTLFVRFVVMLAQVAALPELCSYHYEVCVDALDCMIVH
jgi:hypothetical protein